MGVDLKKIGDTNLGGQSLQEASGRLTVWTVGHSTHSFPEFLDVLAPFGIEAIIDVRRFPGSRRLPQFNEGALRTALSGQNIEYDWLPALGGRRKPDPDSENDGWRHPAFRAYADHLSSEEFASGMADLVRRAQEKRTAMMCSEVLWWRCHRRLISDVLVALGSRVVHIMPAEKSQPHAIRSPARVSGSRLLYPGESEER